MSDISNFKNMLEELEKLEDTETLDFFDYVMRKFNNTVDYATIDEIAIFSFENLREALVYYLEGKINS